jgi:hypothetical protein
MREEFGDIMRVLLVTPPHDKPAVVSDINVEQVSSRRLTSCGFISAIPAFHFARRERLELRTRGRRTSELGSTSKSPAFVEGLGKSANARTIFGATRSPVHHICETTIDLENPRP